jgi:hypothetical protein
MKSVLTRALAPLDAVCIESPRTGLGIPDVNFIGGWFECKNLDVWPKGADTEPVRFHHPLTKEQGVWLYRRARSGGLAMVCARVSISWFFFDGIWIKDRWAKMTRPQMIESADLYMPKRMEKDRLLRFIQERSENFRQLRS